MSVRQLLHGDMVESVRATLAETGLPASHLELEVTESGLMEQGSRAIEVLDRPESVGSTGGAAAGWTVSLGPTITIEGEIVDPKCYLGAMRPGVGEVHRACARVCISGGIPPGLIAPAPAGGERFFLLLDEQGHPPGDAVLAFVGRPVRMTGRVERWNDLDVLRIDPATIAILE